MDVFVMVRRKKTTIFTDATEYTSLGEFKRIIQGIHQVAPENMRLYKDEQALLDDNKSLGDYGFTSTTASAQAPSTIGLVFRQDDGEWEPLEVSPLSLPPELPDVMKPQDTTAHNAPEQAS